MTSKEFYKSYIADDRISPLAENMMDVMVQAGVKSAFEMGAGTGKHLKWLSENGIQVMGIDISLLNCFKAQANLIPVSYGDETNLKFFTSFDVAFTVSVLDHIEDISDIVIELKRMAPTVWLIETDDIINEFYFAHDYEALGFDRMGLSWDSDGDGATYQLYKYSKDVPD